MKIKTKLYALMSQLRWLGATALLGVPVMRALSERARSRRRARVYQEVLSVGLASGKYSMHECEQAAIKAADRS